MENEELFPSFVYPTIKNEPEKVDRIKYQYNLKTALLMVINEVANIWLCVILK